MNEIICAPVLIPTLCRFHHFRNCVESLSRCTLADHTSLYIALDYPAKESHIEGYNLIKEYIPSIKGFKEVVVIERTCNFGAFKNYKDAESLICETYDSFIFTEDDNVFSPNFLCYINKGLALYKDDPRITAIVGYNYPIDMTDYPHDIYYSNQYSAWGTGFWKAKRRTYDMNYISNNLLSLKNALKIYRNNPRLLTSLINIYKTGSILEDVCVTAQNIVESKLSVFPKISKVLNNGNDGSGVHSQTRNQQLFITQNCDTESDFVYDMKLPVEESNKITKQYFNIRLFDKLSLLKKYIEFKTHFCFYKH